MPILLAHVTTLLGSTIRDVLYAIRTFKRAPLVAFTIVSTVALGLGLVTVAFTVLNALLFRVDTVPDVHQMFAVERPRSTAGERHPFTRAQFDALRSETSVFADVYAEVKDVDSVADGRLMFGTFVTGNFFHVLGVTATVGRTLTPADDGPSAAPVIVLSDRGWSRLFARDRAVLGRRLLIGEATFEIVGVMPEQFRGLTIAPDDYWAPLSMLGHVRPTHRAREAAVGVDIIGRLKPDVSRQAALAQLVVWDARQATTAATAREASNLTLVARRGTVEQPLEVVPVTAPLFFAFGLILLIGCANVANLLLARGVARQRDIGIQLSLGATRHRIVRQLLTESLLLALVAAAAAFVISRVVLAVIIDAVMTSMPPDIGDVRLRPFDADWRVLLFLVAGAGVSTIAFALAPALQASRIEPLRTMRGELIRNARPGRARNVLIGMQVSASALLLISAAVFLKSAFAAAAFNPGVRTSDTMFIRVANEQTRTTLVQAVTTDPSIAALAASWPDLAPRAAFAESNGVKASVGYKFVSPEYFDVLDIALVRGRLFTPAERTSTLSVAVVSEMAARTLWPHANAIGQVVRLDTDLTSDTQPASEPALESRTFTIVGIVRDVAGLRIAPLNQAVVYVPTSVEMRQTALVARVHGDPELARQTLVNRLTMIDPNMGREVLTLRTLARAETYFLQIAFWLTVVLGGLALVLTLSGLFSVLSYLVEQRTTEIGVRMALGATSGDVTRLVLTQSFRPVGFGLLIGGGSAAGLAGLLLATPAAAGVGKVIGVLDPIAYAGSLFIIVSACVLAASIPAARAARLDPMRTLRRE
jgi:predicted permease